MTAVRQFPPEAASVAQARSFVRAELGQCSEDIVDRAELLVSELATNAVRHTGTAFNVTVILSDDQVRVEVADTGGGRPQRRSPPPLDPSGRGLQIVAVVSDHWEVRRGQPTGKTVAFVLNIQA